MVNQDTTTKVTVAEALQYDAESLAAAIEKCENNIKLFEETIAAERKTIARYQQMIAIIEAQGQ
jgi:hypothetical protein